MESSNPLVFGPVFWTTIHYVAIGYPDRPSHDQQVAVGRFLESLATLIPCQHCQVHFQTYLREHPVAVSSKSAFFQWTVNFHNAVNIRLGKATWSYPQAMSYYSSAISSPWIKERLQHASSASSSSSTSTSSSSSWSIALTVLSIVCIIGAIVYVQKQCR